MRLMVISGCLAELTVLQDLYDRYDPVEVEDINEALLQGRESAKFGCVRFLADRKIRSKARALVEIDLKHTKQQHWYVVYFNSKGYYVEVQGKRTFLSEMEKV